MKAQPGRSSGFTLIEVMIVVAVIAILAAIAMPAYRSYVQRTQRGTGRSVLLQGAQWLERYRLSNNTYVGGDTGMPGDLKRSPQSGTIQYQVSAVVNSSGYVLQAAPAPGGIMLSDQCGTLQLDQTGAQSVLVGGVAQPNLVSTCWPR